MKVVINASLASRPLVRAPCALRRGMAVPLRATKDEAITGIVFESSLQAEVGPLALEVAKKAESLTESLARQDFHPECEAAINEQINTEYTVSYIYHSMYSYFGRDNVALPGFAKYFKDSSVEEREHAELLMDYQNRRGGKVKLLPIAAPPSEFGLDTEKGDALTALEMTLALEKLNLKKIQSLHEVAEKHGDVPLADFVEGELLGEQVEAVQKVSEMVAQLRRAGKGLGVYLFDQNLQK